MDRARTRRLVRVLTRQDTQRWHSPFSLFLRDWRRDAIVEECIATAKKSGHTAYAIYDADETYLTGGQIAV